MISTRWEKLTAKLDPETIEILREAHEFALYIIRAVPDEVELNHTARVWANNANQCLYPTVNEAFRKDKERINGN